MEFLVISASLSISVASEECGHLSVYVTCVSVSLSGKCTVKKRLNGSGCRLDGEWSRSRNGCIRWGGYHGKGRDSFGVNLGRPVVTNGEFVA